MFGDSCRDGTISIIEFVELWRTTGLSKPVLRQHFRRRDLGNVGLTWDSSASHQACIPVLTTAPSLPNSLPHR